jgi:hypothetical protein
LIRKPSIFTKKNGYNGLYYIQGSDCPVFKAKPECPLLKKDNNCPVLAKGKGCPIKAKATAAGCPLFTKAIKCSYLKKNPGCPFFDKVSFNLSVIKRVSLLIVRGGLLKIGDLTTTG